MTAVLIQTQNLTLEREQQLLLDNANFSINTGDQLLVVGASGCGKSSLAKALAGQLYYRGNIKINAGNDFTTTGVTLVPQFFYFKDNCGLSDFYYQQRYNSQDNESTAKVGDELAMLTNREQVDHLLEILNLRHRISTPLIQLSSGERKKIQLIKALANPTPIIILDTPYIGLDLQAVTNLNHYLQELAARGITLIIIADYCECPDFISKILKIEQRQTIVIGRSEYYSSTTDNATSAGVSISKPAEFYADSIGEYQTLVRFNAVSIRYGEKTILDNISWQIKPGDKWQLSGVNGAGKSTLLSLITGDNPQAYANQIYLFDRRRGSGETIWEIKRNIGYISPELHWNFAQNLSCLNVILSGFFDTPGLYVRANDQQIKLAQQWLTCLGLGEYSNRQFSQFSTGLQRMILLIRAIVKNPPLLIFDEPCQGLDDFHTRQFLALVDELFADSSHAIIYVSHRPDQIPNCIKQRATITDGKLNLS